MHEVSQALDLRPSAPARHGLPRLALVLLLGLVLWGSIEGVDALLGWAQDGVAGLTHDLRRLLACPAGLLAG
jgi:hypothetical protein